MLSTGTPIGNIDSQESVFIEGAPNFYIQDYRANPRYNPDADNYYWGMSGTTSYPVYDVACVQDVSLTEGITMNAIRCDNLGDVGVIQRRDYLEFTLSILSAFPFTSLSQFLNASTPTVATGLEKMGIGAINNNKYFMAYAPKVYNPETNAYLMFHLHKAQFVDAWNISMKAGEPWVINGLKLRAFADLPLSCAQTQTSCKLDG